MMNRLRTAFVSVAAVAVSMIVLGSDARAQRGLLSGCKRNSDFSLKSLPSPVPCVRNPRVIGAKSVPTASQQKYLRLLERLAQGEIKNGISLMQRYSSLERNINRLESIPHPRPRLAREIARAIATDSKQESNDSKQESKVVASLQQNTKALLASSFPKKLHYK